MEQDIYKLLGLKIKELRKKAKLTQAELAEKAGVTQAELSKFETRGEEIRSVSRINALLSSLGYEIDVAEKKTLLTCA
jgi:transcriptional regulator with XRE-family HTH domain